MLNEGGRQPQRRSLTYYLAKFHWKLQENEEIGFGGTHSKFYSAKSVPHQSRNIIITQPQVGATIAWELVVPVTNVRN